MTGVQTCALPILGLVASLARPGGNVTGLSSLVPEAFTEKQIEIFKEMVPKATRFAVLRNPTNPLERMNPELPQTKRAAEKLGLKIQILDARTPEEIDRAFETATQSRAEAIHVHGDPVFGLHSSRIIALAAKAKLPAMYFSKTDVQAGGLMSYGSSIDDLLRRTAGHVDKILKGTAKPGDLPVEQPTRFELVINMKTASELGLTVPPLLLLRADQVIE